MVRMLALAALSVPLGCGTGAFACTSDGQCGDAGLCEADGWCSFPDTTCPAGRRYGSHAGDGLGGACVPSHAEGSTGAAGSGTTVAATSVATTDESSSTSPVSATAGTSSTSSSATETAMSESGSSSTGEPLDPDLLLWLDFDDDAAPWGDRSAYGHDAACETANCPVLEKGTVGYAARFDGVDDRLIVDGGDAFAMPMAFSLALWVTADVLETGVYQDVLTRAFGPTFQNSWALGFPPAVPGMALVVHDGAAQITVGNATWPMRGGWHHIAATWDGATAVLYLDGIVAAEVAVVTIEYDDHPVVVGADLEAEEVVNFFAGAVDDVRVYSRALSEDEVASLI